MQLVEVAGKKLEKDFLLMPLSIYKDDPHYIRPLDKDVLGVFNPEVNKAFRHGEVNRWLLQNDDGEYIGRIAAFVNKKYKSKGDTQPTGGIGFFECINNQEAADMLFDVSKSWLMQRGMEAMDGPINFGERDKFWGLVVEGFMEPIYQMNYNPPYYQELFENYGFKLFYKQMCYAMKVSQPLDEKFYKQHAKVKADGDFKAKMINKRQLKKFSDDFTRVYNEAWASHEGNKTLREDVAYKMFQAMKPVIDERIVWYVYYKDRPVAIWLNLPDLNQIFKKFNGKFGLIEKIRFLIMKARKMNTKFTGIIFGVVPEFQGKGVDSFMIIEGANLIKGKSLYEDYEMQWQGDFNPKMLNISKNLGAYPSRILITYRYLFDRTKEYKRHPIFH
ncbi:MAG: hypothetical protein J5I50_07195 [Chitinophagaceae bacterium]|nr:hypothetical protein [Chitinophagaceae bacterium]